jgi:enamine deaminase RidA (YjgF/YER057c/UK114 family)
MIQRKNFSSETPWESIVGYSRAVRIGNYICVSGTTATDKDGNIVGESNSYEQTIQIIKNIQTALNALGAELKDVIRTRIYVTDIDNWKEVGKAHAEYFKQIRPSCTMVQVNKLINPKIMVEIEVDAIVIPTSCN